MKRLAVATLFVSALIGPLRVVAQERKTDPLPVEQFFKRPQYGDMSLSPDAKLLATLAPLGGRRNLAIIDLESRKAFALTQFSELDVYTYSWIGDRLIEMTLANTADASGLIRVQRRLLVDVEKRTLVPGNYGTVIAILDRNGENLVMQAPYISAGSQSAYRYNARTGERTLLTRETPGRVASFTTDHRGQVRLALSTPRRSSRAIFSYRRSNDDPWTTLADEAFGEQTLIPIAFDADDRLLYVLSRTMKDAAFELRSYDPETRTLGERLTDNKVGQEYGVVFDTVARRTIGVAGLSDQGQVWIDPEWQDLQRAIDQALPAARNTLSWGRNDTSRLLVRSESGRKPPRYYLFERPTRRLEEVASAYPWLAETDLSPRDAIEYKARDGLVIHAYLTMPRSFTGAKPPLVVNIHGGPHALGARFGFDAEAQFFASRGYAVLEPNFRGTLGYGDAYYKAGWKQWGLSMQDDVTDGVKFLIETGKVDPDRVCLFGGSYGGYATLWGLEKEPAMFRCGVAFVAVSDMTLLFDVGWTDRLRGSMDKEEFDERVTDDPVRDEQHLRDVSPVNHAERIRVPVLLAYGEVDRRVPLRHGKLMRDALDRHKKPYEWVVYDDEGHGFNKMENLIDFYRRVDVFLAKHLAPLSVPTAANTAP
jgi:dipeptidyl aminopeptidase/acylaminoacyl peptidase